MILIECSLRGIDQLDIISRKNTLLNVLIIYKLNKDKNWFFALRKELIGAICSLRGVDQLHIVGGEEAVVATGPHALPPALVDPLDVGHDLRGVERDLRVVRRLVIEERPGTQAVLRQQLVLHAIQLVGHGHGKAVLHRGLHIRRHIGRGHSSVLGGGRGVGRGYVGSCRQAEVLKRKKTLIKKNIHYFDWNVKNVQSWKERYTTINKPI